MDGTTYEHGRRSHAQRNEEEQAAPQPRRGMHLSLKMGRAIPYDSPAKRDLLLLLDSDPAVVGYSDTDETLLINHTLQDQQVTHQPDYLVQTRSYTALVDCIPAHRYTRKGETLMREAVHAWAAQHPTATTGPPGTLDYIVFTSTQLDHNYYMHNIRLLTPYGHATLQPGIRARIYSVLDTAPIPTTAPVVTPATPGTITIGELAQRLAFASPDAARHAIYYLAYHRELVLPLADQHVTDTTPVYLPHQQPIAISYPPPTIRFPIRAGLPTHSATH
ncbi:MAG: hypothetical protein M3441_20825 [Chloroflexota bacterium]|nr:hypothetical protein [Chloroflexota bacterium]